ncbi:alpha/beta hydrolase [Micromonospora andamanensis]|uniref:alpha/beta fold hydrolase n=1 Tax=Micromonospora andamanensis TaxID=1287068 RepID=UPI00194DD114|nr:alpha/beta hydrolase [Micromonospora andamanensis]GIJ39757.1 alpha/beta hydrolase [Micromonospora andamanensis]
MSSFESLSRLDLSYPEDARRIRTRADVELYYEVRGEGTPITLLNHFLMSAPLWRVFTEDLARSYRLISYDLCNHGASSHVAEEPTWAEHVDDLVALLDALEIESTYLIAASASTVLARDMALMHPDRVKGMVLAGPVYGPKGMRRQRQLQRAWLRTIESHGIVGFYEHLYPELFSAEMNEALGTPGFLGLREAFTAVTTLEDLVNGLNRSLVDDHKPEQAAGVQAPTLIVVGDDDLLLSPTGARELAEQFPNGSYEIMPRAGHQPFLDDAAGFQAIVRKFVDEVQSRA